MCLERSCGAVVFTRVNGEIRYVVVTEKEGAHSYPKGHMEGNETEEETARREIFEEITDQIYPLFKKYGVECPTLRIRNMETRWGTCLAKKGIITLNKRLLEAPRSCIEYVVMHEMCHFIHANHSRQFYEFLTMMMPDWKDRRDVLNRCFVSP